MPILQQDVSYVVSAVLAELLVKRLGAHRRRITLHLDHVAVDGLGFLTQRQQRRLVLRINFDLTVGEINRDFVKDVVVVELAKAGDGSINRLFVFANLRLLLGQLGLLLLKGRVLRFQRGVLLFYFRLVFLRFCLSFMHAGLNGLCLFQIAARECDGFRDEAMRSVVSAFYLYRQAGNESGHRHFFAPGL